MQKTTHQNGFNSLMEVIEYFKDDKTCMEYLQEWRWKGKIACPHCDHDKSYKFSDGIRFKCAKCRKQFNAKVGTFFHKSYIPLRKWLMAIYLLGTDKKSISSYQLAKNIKVTQKTAYFMMQRLRRSFEQQTIKPLEGAILADETFVGGKNKNRHIHKKVKNSAGRFYKDKAPVLGMLEAGGTLKAFVVPNTAADTLQPIIKHVVKKGSILITDEWSGYKGIEKHYEHHVVDHTKKNYVDDQGFTTNPLEGFWANLKRSILGVWHSISKKHLQRYVDETVFKYNFRNSTFGDMLREILSKCDRRLTYKRLVYGKD